MEKLLEVQNVCKKIGFKNILNDMSFTLEKGKVLGVMGPNGNGKTTLLNIIGGLLKKTSGDIFINGKAISINTKNDVAFLQDKIPFKKYMLVKDAVNFYSDFFEDFDRKRMSELLIKMNLEENMKIRNMSKGMVEKLSLSLTMSRKAKLYLLDEPITGVDPVSREKILDLIIESISEESSMIITTHYVGELERVFDEVLFIGEGRVVESGNAEDLRIKYDKSIDEIYREIFAE